MKFIFITDTHAMGSNPGSRLDNFPEALLKKMQYIGEYAEEIGATGILHGGDWLHSPDISENYIREFSKIIKNYPCPVYGILGNHDIFGQNPTTFNRTSFGVAEGLDLFTRLYIDKPVILSDNKTKVVITGQDSHYNLDKDGVISDYTDSTIIDGAVSIHIVHGMLVEKDWPQVKHYTTINSIKNCNADIILTGHEHTGFGVKTIFNDNNEKKIFCNPGSLSRITSSVGDLRKDVRMAVIDIEGNDFNVELVNLPNSVVESSNKVLDSQRLAEEKANKENLDKFLIKMNRASIDNSFNVYDALKLLSGEINDNNVIEECRKQLQIAEEELNK